MASFEESVRYPMNSDDWLKTLLIGGVLLLFSFLVIPAIAVYGYVVTAIRDSLDGKSEPPAFEDWGDLLRKGALGWVIGVVYMLVPIVVAAVTVGGSIAAILTGSRAGQAAGFAGILGGIGLSLVLTLVFGYFAVVALVNFARTDEFRDAFDFTTIRQVGLNRDYVVPWLLSIVVFVVASIVGSALNVVPLLGAVLSAFVFFYAEVVAARFWADGFAAAFEEDRSQPAGIEEPTV